MSDPTWSGKKHTDRRNQAETGDNERRRHQTESIPLTEYFPFGVFSFCWGDWEKPGAERAAKLMFRIRLTNYTVKLLCLGTQFW